MGRAPCCERVGLNKGRWTAAEDEILLNYVNTHGVGAWRSLPKNAGLKRCGKSCRLRWMNYLRPELKKSNICPDEDDLIIKLHASHGNKWSLIAGHLPGRTDNEIKNYWNSHLSRRITTFPNAETGELVTFDLGKLGYRWRRGRTSRAAMKKNYFPCRNRSDKNAGEMNMAGLDVIVGDLEYTVSNSAGSSCVDDEIDGLDEILVALGITDTTE